MLVAGIILTILIVIFLIPVGVDVAYDSSGFSLAMKIGPVFHTLFPKPALSPEEAEQKARKDAEKARKKREKDEKKKSKSANKPKKKPDVDYILALVRMGMNALKRFGKKLTVDYLRLYWIAAASDPCDAAIQYGRISAVIHVVPQMVEQVMHIREHDLRTDLSFETNSPVITARCVLDIRVGEILWIALAFGAEFLIWKLRHRSVRNGAERKNENGKQ